MVHESLQLRVVSIRPLWIPSTLLIPTSIHALTHTLNLPALRSTEEKDVVAVCCYLLCASTRAVVGSGNPNADPLAPSTATTYMI